ncbi:hypothetical protein Pyn_07039 [Prunus yedoensis var. nudiflora]|uniref:Secreted protein n=1 Tax=Prunus yedoensis var. nudiflora TaxID=2094558 RepID=A0A314UMD4_PRUYE|nr:hypothetical protein Pyn_07039 [Prunus yedoensis var. nudiflora]
MAILLVTLILGMIFGLHLEGKQRRMAGVSKKPGSHLPTTCRILEFVRVFLATGLACIDKTERHVMNN